MAMWDKNIKVNNSDSDLSDDETDDLYHDLYDDLIKAKKNVNLSKKNYYHFRA